MTTLPSMGEGGGAAGRPWWQRWDGLPPGMERRLSAWWAGQLAATGWRRWFGGTWLHVLSPLLLGVAQVGELVVGGESTAMRALRGGLLALCIVGVAGNGAVIVAVRRRRAEAEAVRS